MEDQELLLDENGLSDNRTDATWTQEAMSVTITWTKRMKRSRIGTA
jgi:hypothetical protein